VWVGALRKPDVDIRALEDLLARFFGSRNGITFERTPTGSSTQVYRVRRGEESFYLRVAEEPEASLAPEVEVHRVLHAAGVRVPEVTHYEPFDDALCRSVMVVTEIVGGPLDGSAAGAAVGVLRAAGRDLATIHSVPVHGFGWVQRDHRQPGWPLRGEHGTYADYVDPGAVAEPLLGVGFTVGQVDQVVQLLEEAVVLGPDDATGALAHGDFDASHIFASGGAYTGLIDFGEIRGTDYTFDFATTCLHVDDASGPLPDVRRAVEQGYAEVRDLPADHERRVYLACVLSASHRLSGWYLRDGERAADGWFFRWIRECLVRLLESGRAL
jgi:Ser/Thr protein kinase RdoA (MazF antagonist)